MHSRHGAAPGGVPRASVPSPARSPRRAAGPLLRSAAVAVVYLPPVRRFHAPAGRAASCRAPRGLLCAAPGAARGLDRWVASVCEIQRAWCAAAGRGTPARAHTHPARAAAQRHARARARALRTRRAAPRSRGRCWCRGCRPAAALAADRHPVWRPVLRRCARAPRGPALPSAAALPRPPGRLAAPPQPRAVGSSRPRFPPQAARVARAPPRARAWPARRRRSLSM